ncbi:MAG: 3'(2'),5'-bisphosphate nucleotidase CysQ [Rhodocyclaceae bacterium]|jgi:3'(2'), 5'-bisphosphate nucleotidase|nr:3'(2'),5'-bisphosphate nucleotidase CysQ [Rhodocyclaceae bacterium]
MHERLLDQAVRAARKAGRVILEHYRQREAIGPKSDGSPLAKADLAAHGTICTELKPTGIPIVSEEGEDLRLQAARYWLIDPLDGTKEFLAGNDEFTVNIALIEGRRPVLGVVLAPALDELYAGGPDTGTWAERHGAPRSACTPRERSETCRMAISRFHNHPDAEGFAIANRVGLRLEIGSALKFGRLAAAEVDVYPRFAGSSEWDIAAGQAVLEGAGGAVLDWNSGRALEYGKPRRRNPRLLALRSPYTRAEFECHPYAQEIP